jgi:hypothetical protein
MTDISRRGLIGAGAAGVILGALAPGSEAFAAVAPQRRYTRSRFTPLRGRRFKLTSGSRSTTVTLAKVSDLPYSRKGASGCFALTFRSATAGPPQGSYTLRRRGFAPTTLFVVPSDTSRRTYEAIVNRAG